MALLDTTIVNVALPSIRTGCTRRRPAWSGSSPATCWPTAWPWCPAGRVGDRFGHQPLFLVGLTLFTLASVACGLAQHPDQLVAARVVQGLGAGVFFPAIAAPIQLSFTGPGPVQAFGVLGAVIGLSTALGPLLGGLLIQAAGARDGWRWVFLVNVPIGLVAVPLAAWLLPAPGGARPARVRRGRRRAAHRGAAAVAGPAGRGAAAGWPAWMSGPASAGAPSPSGCWPRGRCEAGAAATRCSSPRLVRQMLVLGRGRVRAGLLRRLHQRVLHAVDPVAGRARAQRAVAGLVHAPFPVGSLIAAARRTGCRPGSAGGPGARLRMVAAGLAVR